MGAVEASAARLALLAGWQRRSVKPAPGRTGLGPAERLGSAAELGRARRELEASRSSSVSSSSLSFPPSLTSSSSSSSSLALSRPPGPTRPPPSPHANEPVAGAALPVVARRRAPSAEGRVTEMAPRGAPLVVWRRLCGAHESAARGSSVSLFECWRQVRRPSAKPEEPPGELAASAWPPPAAGGVALVAALEVLVLAVVALLAADDRRLWWPIGTKRQQVVAAAVEQPPPVAGQGPASMGSDRSLGERVCSKWPLEATRSWATWSGDWLEPIMWLELRRAKASRVGNIWAEPAAAAAPAPLRPTGLLSSGGGGDEPAAVGCGLAALKQQAEQVVEALCESPKKLAFVCSKACCSWC